MIPSTVMQQLTVSALLSCCDVILASGRLTFNEAATLRNVMRMTRNAFDPEPLSKPTVIQLEHEEAV